MNQPESITLPEHAHHGDFLSREWKTLSHDDMVFLVTEGEAVLARARTLSADRFPYALAEGINRHRTRLRAGPESSRLRQLWTIVVGRPRDARRLREHLLATEVAS